MRNGSRAAQLRERIAREAGRLMHESGIRDYELAKRKAAARLNLGASVALPRNREVELAAREYQRLFHAEASARALRERLAVAREAMRLLARFRPRLVGPLLDGVAEAGGGVSLHLLWDPPEEVALFLAERGIDHQAGEQRLRVAGGEQVRLPAYRFLAGEVAVELVVFAARMRRRVPLSPVDGRPMRRAALAEVERLRGLDG